MLERFLLPWLSLLSLVAYYWDQRSLLAMAREEHDREDLMAEARSLAARAEVAVPSQTTPIVLGHRANGGWSFYFSPDDVYHFNSQGQLRRAYLQGLLVKAENGHLVSLERRRAKQEVQLLRRELPPAEQAALLANLASWFDSLREAVSQSKLAVLRSEPPGAHLVPQLAAWLAQRSELTIANSPHAL